MTKKAPTPAPRRFRITDNVPEGARVQPPQQAVRLLVQFFGEEAMRRAAAQREATHE